MYTDFKIRTLIEKHGLEGYAIWLLCLEFLGKEGEKKSKEGKKWSLNGQTRWKEHLMKVAGWSENGKLESILGTLAELKLICSKSLKYGNLYSPNFKERADEYTRRQLRLISEQTTDNILLDKNRIDKNRIDKIRIEYIKLKGWDIKNFFPDDFARTAKAIKTLVFKAKGKEELVLEGLAWISKQRYEWSLETLVKQWAKFMKENKRYEPPLETKPEPINEEERKKVTELIHETTLKMKEVK